MDKINTQQWNTFVLNTQRRVLLWKENVASIKWMWQHRHEVPWLKDFVSTCGVHEISLSKGNKSIEWAVELGKLMPKCFDRTRIPEYRHMIEACDLADDWKEQLTGEAEETARKKLDYIQDNYHLIPQNFELTDYAEDMDYL